MATTIQLSTNPPVEITVPNDFVVDDNLINLLKDVVPVTSIENDKTSEQGRKTDFQEGFSKGVGASIAFFDGQPECPPYVQKALRRLGGLPEPPTPSPTLWERPTYRNAFDYIQGLPSLDRVKLIGKLDGEPVRVVLVGHVETQIRDDDSDDEFLGCCEMALRGDSPVFTGFILGSIGTLGTALIIANDDRLYAYSPEDAIDKSWDKLGGFGGEIIIDGDHNISIREVRDLQVASLGEWF